MKRLLLALVSLALVASAAAAASTPASDGKTLDLTGTVTAFHVALDAEPTGQSAGDIGYETGNLFMHGKRIGRFQGVCAQLPHASSQCSFTLGLPDGQILIQAAYGPGFDTGARPGTRPRAQQQQTRLPSRTDPVTAHLQATSTRPRPLPHQQWTHPGGANRPFGL
jgi:hypothetical protein